MCKNYMQIARKRLSLASTAALVALALTTTACDNAAEDAAIQVTVSGEALALTGYNFPAAAGQELAFVDGWDVKFDTAIAVIDRVTFSEDPDRNAADQSEVGTPVAELVGPWAVDLTNGGPLTGKGGEGEEAVELGVITSQNLNDDAPFNADTRYAFSFTTIKAAEAATKLSFDAESEAAYETMLEKGYSFYVAGTATFKGTDCRASAEGYDYSALPETVRFEFGFEMPAQNLNCQNPDNAPADPLDGEEAQRGVQLRSNETVVAQVTFHTDHLFWGTFVHDAPLMFDHIAAQAVGRSGTPTVTLEDLAGVAITGITDASGAALPYRSCVDEADYNMPTQPQMSFETEGVAVDPDGNPAEALRDVRDFITLGTSTFGHLNADGICYTAHDYPSPAAPEHEHDHEGEDHDHDEEDHDHEDEDHDHD